MDFGEEKLREIEALSTEELEDRLARGVYGPRYINFVENTIARRKESEKTALVRRELAATDVIATETARLAAETARLAAATEHLGGVTRNLVKATWGLFWVTTLLVGATIFFNLIR